MTKVTYSPAETAALAAEIAEKLKGGETLVLRGGLGAGKTTFTKGLAKALGVTRNVVSPTFTLVREYEEGRLKLYHFDLYRIEDEGELEELGLDEYFRDDSVVVIEWNRISRLPGKVTEIVFTVNPDSSRTIEVIER